MRVASLVTLLHSPNPLSAGAAFESFLSPDDFDAVNDVVDRLLFESGNGEQFAGPRQFFEMIDILDVKSVVDFLRGFRPDTGNGNNLQQAQRHFLFQFLKEFDFAGCHVFRNFRGKVFADSRNLTCRTARHNGFDVVGERFQIVRRTPVGTYAKRIRTLDFEQIRDPVKHRRNFNVAHFVIVQEQDSSRLFTSVLYSLLAFIATVRGPLAQLAEQLTLNQ